MRIPLEDVREGLCIALECGCRGQVRDIEVLSSHHAGAQRRVTLQLLHSCAKPYYACQVYGGPKDRLETSEAHVYDRAFTPTPDVELDPLLEELIDA